MFKHLKLPDWCIIGALVIIGLMSGISLAKAHDFGGIGLRLADRSTVDLGVRNLDGTFKAQATGVMVPQGVLTADHVCEALSSMSKARVQFKAGYTVQPLSYVRSPDVNDLDLCIIQVPQYNGIKRRWADATLAHSDLLFGARAYHIGNYLEPRWMAEGPVGGLIRSEMPGRESMMLRPMYTLAGPGSSGGGIWNTAGELVGIGVQARVFRSGGGFGGGSVMGQGVVYYVPLFLVKSFLSGS
jgi:S1-C subfamily serine protease